MEPDVIWYGQTPDLPAFTDLGQTLAFVLDGSQTGREPDQDFYVACNSYLTPETFCIPHSPSGRNWARVVDTALPSPTDILEHEDGPAVPVQSGYVLQPFAMLILITRS
jgi:glycogen operon protein